MCFEKCILLWGISVPSAHSSQFCISDCQLRWLKIKQKTLLLGLFFHNLYLPHCARFRDLKRAAKMRTCWRFLYCSQNRLSRSGKLTDSSKWDIPDSISRISTLDLFYLHTFLISVSVFALGFIMLTQPCSSWPICQTLLALSICLDLDWIKTPTDKMMATSAPVWKTLHVCPADLLALSHPQANHSQSQGCRGEVSEESQHLIGE